MTCQQPPPAVAVAVPYRQPRRKPNPKYINIWSFLVVFCTCYCITAITSSFLVSVIQSIERQFQIPSRMSGTIMSANRIGYLLTVVFLAYFGSKGNRARWIGGGCLVIGASCFLIASPHFFFNQGHSSPVKEAILFQPLTPTDVKLFRRMTNMSKNGLWSATANDGGNATAISHQDLLQVDDDVIAIVDLASNAAQNAEDDVLAEDPIAELAPAPSRRVKRQNGNMQNGTVQNGTVQNGEMQNGNMQNGKLQNGFLAISYAVEWLLTENEKTRLIKEASQSIGYCNEVVNKLKVALRDYKCSIAEPNTIALGLIFLGIFIIGIGNTMPHTLGMPLVDDHIKRGSTPLYFGGLFAIRILGPFSGFLLGGACSALYYTLSAPQGLTPSDPRWIGAWWLGYIIIGSSMIIPAVLMFFFPLDLIATTEHPEVNDKTSIQKRKHNSSSAAHEDIPRPSVDGVAYKKKPFSLKKEVKGFTTALVAILKSPIYTGALIGRLVDGFGASGFRGFIPKYLDNHYGLSANVSATVLAPINIASVISGVLFGSLIMHRMKLDGRRAVNFIILSTITSAVMSYIKSGLGCHSVVNKVGRIGGANGFNFTTTCNQNCGCDVVHLYPVCSRNGDIFYSPCHAGCRTMEHIKGVGTNLSDCLCAEGGSVSRDWCQDDCRDMLIIYLTLNIIGGLIVGISITPSLIISLRSVPHKFRSIALGFSGFVSNLLSSVPSSIVYGMIIDTACLQWGNNCGKSGSCEIYDPERLRWRPHIFMATTKIASLVFDIWVWYWAKDLVLLEAKTEQPAKEDQTQENGKFLPSKEYDSAPLTASEQNEVLQRTISVDSDDDGLPNA